MDHPGVTFHRGGTQCGQSGSRRRRTSTAFGDGNHTNRAATSGLDEAQLLRDLCRQIREARLARTAVEWLQRIDGPISFDPEDLLILNLQRPLQIGVGGAQAVDDVVDMGYQENDFPVRTD